MVSLRRRLPRAITVVAVLILAFATTACGGADADVESDPEGALRSAVESLGDWEGVALQASLQADDAARSAILAEGEMSEDELDLLLTASLGVIATGDDNEGAAAFDVTVGGSQVAAIQVHEELDLYLRIDLEAIMELVDDPEAEAEIAEALGMADEFGLGAAASSLSAGEWIRLTGLQQAASLFGGMAGVEDPDEPDEEETERLAEEMAATTLAFLDRDVDVSYVGSEDAGERVRATTDGAAVQSYLGDLTDLMAANDLAGGFGGEMVEDDFQDIPDDVTVNVDVWIDGGEVSQFAIDIAAFDDEIAGEMLLVVAMEEHTGGLEPPEEATDVDVFEIVGQFMGGFGGGFADDGFDDDGFDDSFEDDSFEDDSFEDDSFEDDGVGDDVGLSEEEIDMLVEDLVAGGECIEEEELDFFESFFGPEAGDAIRSLVDQGTIEYC